MKYSKFIKTYGEDTPKLCHCNSFREIFNCNIILMLLLIFWKGEVSHSATLNQIDYTSRNWRLLTYSLIAFHKRVTFWLKRTWPLATVFLLLCLRVLLCNGYTQTYAQIKQHTQTYKAVDVRVKAKKLLYRQRQLDYIIVYHFSITIGWFGLY